MASELGQPPPAKRPPTAPTTITAIGDDLLLEIFLLLPSLPSLVRAALACRTFLHAVRSSPAFRRRFRAIHPPQLLGFFEDTESAAVPPFVPLRGRSDPDLAAAVRGADFLLTRIPEDSCDSTLGWVLESFHGGYIVLVNNTTDQVAAYNALTQALHLFPQLPEGITMSPDFHILFSEEDQRVFSMVCVQHWGPRCVVVFSSASKEWQVLPWVEPPPPPEDDEDDTRLFHPGTQLNGFIYWKHHSQAYVLALNTATMQFSRVNLPHFLAEIDRTLFRLGQTKDGKLCMVGADDSDAKIGTLVVRVWGPDDDGVEKWILEDTFSLSTFIDVTKSSTEYDTTVQIEKFVDGFVYLSITYDEHTESLISLCLETGKLNKIFADTYKTPAHPYIMSWPPSLACNKDDSQTKITGGSVEDAGSVGTIETPSVLVTAPQSHKFD